MAPWESGGAVLTQERDINPWPMMIESERYVEPALVWAKQGACEDPMKPGPENVLSLNAMTEVVRLVRMNRNTLQVC